MMNVNNIDKKKIQLYSKLQLINLLSDPSVKLQSLTLDRPIQKEPLEPGDSDGWSIYRQSPLTTITFVITR